MTNKWATTWGNNTKNTFGTTSFGQTQTSQVKGGFQTRQSSQGNDKVQQGGWGHKPQAQNTTIPSFGVGATGGKMGTMSTGKGFGTGGFGTGGFGTGGFGTGSFGGSFGLGGSISFAGAKPAFGSLQTQQRRKVPISTFGISFMEKMMQIKGGPNQAPKPFKVHHITSIPMFGAYTIDELRIYDRISEGTLQEPEGFKSQVGQPIQQQQTTGFAGFGKPAGVTTDQKQESQPVDWSTVPVKSWGEIKLPTEDANSTIQPYGTVSITHKTLNIVDTSKKLHDEDFQVQQKVPLKGFKNRHTFFDQYESRKKKENSNSADNKIELKFTIQNGVDENQSTLSSKPYSVRNPKTNVGKSLFTLGTTKVAREGLDYRKDLNGLYVPEVLAPKENVPDRYQYKSPELVIPNFRICYDFKSNMDTNYSISLNFLEPCNIQKLNPVTSIQFAHNDESVSILNLSHGNTPAVAIFLSSCSNHELISTEIKPEGLAQGVFSLTI